MNNLILNQYQVTFFKNENGIHMIKSHHLDLAIYISMFTLLNELDLLLNDIEQCLNDNYNSIDNPVHIAYVGTDAYFGRIFENNTFQVDYDIHFEIFPLSDIKEILLSWKEFISN